MQYGCQSMVGKIKSIIIKHPENAFISQKNLDEKWKAYNYVSCPDYEKSLEEYKTFEEIIKANVENVNYLPKDDNTGLDSIYTHDTCKITSKGAIMFTVGKELRRGESGATKNFLKSLGVPILGEITGEGTMEGGDVVWLDEKTIAVGRGYRTNYEGIRQLREMTKDIVDEFIVVELPHGDGPDECLHLMSVISMVDKDLAVVYSKFMPVSFRDKLIERGIELIEVYDEEYANLGSNVLALAPRLCVMPAGNPKTKEKLEKAGARVFEYGGNDISFKGTGGPTCLTLPVTRL
ncbi:dimethylarginine dimethylaminohydrolase family protein [Proteocatella sphenisci]|uniref:dimethylarginine dimethylaminohydrolase family protein n=1 Tax=Proteocatella sphenisci TaxID=181070 RepID=UPI00048DC5D7|nr:arginine deiminase family protein [Proteocatella sphenisci]